METYPTLKSEIGMQPPVPVADGNGICGRQEQEMIQEMRQQAICHWLQQLPLPDEHEKQRTMWSSYDDKSATQHDALIHWGRRDLDDVDDKCDLPTEESPVASFEKKSMPAENEEYPVRGLESMKGREMEFERRLSGATAFREPRHSLGLNEQFSKKWNVDSDSTEQESPEKSRHPLQSVEEDVSSGQEEAVSEEGDWSAMSDCLETSVQKEDTAYGGSANGSGKERRFHVKYSVADPVVAPPQTQCIEPHTSTTPYSLPPADLKVDAGGSSPGAASSGEWWSPQMFFKGLVGMVCNVGLMVEDDAESEQSCYESDDGAEMGATNERVLRRLAHCKAQSIGRRSAIHRPSMMRLGMRMRQEKRRHDAKRREMCYQLQHPMGMKLMEPAPQSRIQDPLTPPPGIRATEYRPPLSVTDLSDFESFLGPVQCALAQEDTAVDAYAGIGHCQTWFLENLWCILGGRPRMS